MKRLKLKSATLLALVFSFFVAITSFAGEGNSLIMDAYNYTGAPTKPYIFADDFSWGPDTPVNNGFYLPANNGVTKYVKFTGPEQGGYFVVEFAEDENTSVYFKNQEKYYKEGEMIYVAPKETVLLGITGITTERFVNFKMHEHRKMHETYEADGDTCKLISYCGCGYKGIPEAYSVAKRTHEYGAASVTKPTCTAAGYSSKACKNCGHVSKETGAAVLGHSYTGAVTKYNDYSHKISCSRCSSYETKGHTFISNGSTKTCTICKLTVAANTGAVASVTIVPGTVKATKLDSKRVSVTVTVPYGATSTDVYMNGNKIKTLTGNGYFVVDQKGATSAKYKVASNFIVDSKAQSSAFSAEVKPEKNEIVYSGVGNLNPKNVGRYSTCSHKTASLKFSGKKLKCTAYIYNNRIFKLKKIRIHYTLRVNGKTYNKNISMKCNIKAYGKKKISYYLGKGITDLRNGIEYKSVYIDGNWGYGWNK